MLSSLRFPIRGEVPIGFFSAALACLGWPPKGSKLFLDEKFNKNQGLELMSDKFVKALISAAQAPDEGSGKMRCLGLWWFESLGFKL